MNEGVSSIFGGSSPASTFTSHPPYSLPVKKSKKKIIIIAASALLFFGIAAAIIFSLLVPDETKIGEANNDGFGEILLITAGPDEESSYYRINDNGSVYKVSNLDFDFTKHEGLSAIPLSCARTLFYARTQDAILCDSDSPNPEDFGSEFFSLLRQEFYNIFADIVDLDRRAMIRQIFKSNNRVFLNVLFITDGNRPESILLEYREFSLIKVITFEQEQIQWVEVRESSL
jgi:hypothetical protein